MIYIPTIEKLVEKYVKLSEEELRDMKKKYANQLQEVANFTVACMSVSIFGLPAYLIEGEQRLSIAMLKLRVGKFQDYLVECQKQVVFEKTFGSYGVSSWSIESLRAYQTSLMGVLTAISKALAQVVKTPIDLVDEDLPEPDSLL